MQQQDIVTDPRAVEIPAYSGVSQPDSHHKVIVIGGGIAGLAAACGLVERGVEVQLVEAEEELGGRVRSWQTSSAAGTVTMSRGFHAFFRQYYNLRMLLSRAGDLATLLRPVEDYPVVSVKGDKDSFTKIPRTPPWNFISFVVKSPTFTMKDLVKVDLDTALSLLDVNFPETYRELDGVSAADFLDKLKFPDRARHLALEVFARSFFADPRDFSAGELVAMFHTYFLGSAEGLLFDVPKDDFDTSLWKPLSKVLEQQGMSRVHAEVASFQHTADDKWVVNLSDGSELSADAVILAAGPRASKNIVASSAQFSNEKWSQSVQRVRLAPPFGVLRVWFDGKVNAERPAFLGTAGFGPLDNITVLERFEAGAAKWSEQHNASVVELHAYALPQECFDDPQAQQNAADQLMAELARVYPETSKLGVIAQELLFDQDCALIGTDSWQDRAGVSTSHKSLKLAGDWVRCDQPIALMERAATTGFMAANELLQQWGIAGHTLWSVPTASRQSWPGSVRRMLRKKSTKK